MTNDVSLHIWPRQSLPPPRSSSPLFRSVDQNQLPPPVLPCWRLWSFGRRWVTQLPTLYQWLFAFIQNVPQCTRLLNRLCVFFFFVYYVLHMALASSLLHLGTVLFALLVVQVYKFFFINGAVYADWLKRNSICKRT